MIRDTSNRARWRSAGGGYRFSLLKVTIPFGTAPGGNAPTGPNIPPNFATWADANAWYQTYFPYYGDVAHLDGDGNGIPCQSLPGAP